MCRGICTSLKWVCLTLETETMTIRDCSTSVNFCASLRKRTFLSYLDQAPTYAANGTLAACPGIFLAYDTFKITDAFLKLAFALPEH